MTYAGLGQSDRLSAGTVSFLNDKLGIATRNSGGSTDTYTRSPDGTILGEKVGTSNYYFLVDGLGSVIAVTDTNGNTSKDSGGVNTFIYKYEPYGSRLNSPPASFPTQPFRFAGYYWGLTYGLYKVGERYYDPTTGRWRQQDPVEDPLDERGWNHYAYAPTIRSTSLICPARASSVASAAGAVIGAAAGTVACAGLPVLHGRRGCDRRGDGKSVHASLCRARELDTAKIAPYLS